MEADRRAIHDLVLRYCRGIDRIDLELVRSCYHPGGIDHHTGFDGPVEEYVEWLRPLLGRSAGGTHHMVGNHLAEVRGDVAVAETYAHATHWGGPEDPPSRFFTTGVRYVDHLERRDDRWGIVERWAVREWTRQDAGRLSAPAGTLARRDGTDPIERLRTRLLG
ncbi:nuclear transport factor 2 family protein [Nocardioides daejeonensis]|uniref:nuclear transport factor 2 family protein n=1 Tax=Nocardioides daejeonensis TaxID=1046556 RepID=UPI000D74BDBE|nr:nuclear transport factor 2 family protein [Nocardioides daejeonensis]